MATKRLLAARRTGQTQLAMALPNADCAYRVQAAVADSLGWFKEGAVRHWKSGGAGRDAVLTHAPLPPVGICSSPADLRSTPLHFRGIEAEIALRIGESVDSARAALDRPLLVDAMCAAIEVVDSRWVEGMQADPWAKLADLQSHGALVLGGWKPFEQRDWLTQSVRVEIGSKVRKFKGTHALGDPTWGLTAWMRHATRNGSTLQAGTVITTGTWCGLSMAQAGDTVVVAFDGIGQACLRF